MNTCRQPFLLFMHMQPSKLLTYKEEKKNKKEEGINGEEEFLGHHFPPHPPHGLS